MSEAKPRNLTKYCILLFAAGIQSLTFRCADITAFNQEVSLEKFLSTVGAAGDTTTTTTTANDATSASSSSTGTPGSAAATNDANYEVNISAIMLALCVKLSTWTATAVNACSYCSNSCFRFVHFMPTNLR
jgi:hypothetical protein